MSLDLQLLTTVFLATIPFSVAFLTYVHKMDNRISVLQNDVSWLKEKSLMRRKEDFLKVHNQV